MVNPPLLFVSALFFLGISALLYSGAWILVKTLLRIQPHLSPHRTKGLLTAALLLPPIISCAVTAGGAFLRHSHAPGAVHHNVYCENLAQYLALPEGNLPALLGLTIQGAAWLLLAWGVLTVCRLLHATIMLERGLSPYLHPPSEQLAAAVSSMRSKIDCSGLEFYEADVPMAFSCLIGIRRIRCVLSRQLVAATTRDELEAVVLHEASHFRAGDVWRTLVLGMLDCLFYLIPAVGLLSRRWREETELVCDAATTKATGEPLALASAILRAQGVPIQGPGLPTTTLAFTVETAAAEARVERLLAYARGTASAIDAPRMDSWQWVLASILFAIGLVSILSPEALCISHCSLEAMSRVLH